MNSKGKAVLVVATPIVIAGVLIFIINKKKKPKTSVTVPVTGGGTTTGSTKTIPQSPLSSGFPLKVGSKNANVKILQQILDVTQDGIFGAKTEAALVDYNGKTQVDSLAELNQMVMDSIIDGAVDAEGAANIGSIVGGIQPPSIINLWGLL